jgi:hypothetical protein
MVYSYEFGDLLLLICCSTPNAEAGVTEQAKMVGRFLPIKQLPERFPAEFKYDDNEPKDRQNLSWKKAVKRQNGQENLEK